MKMVNWMWKGKSKKEEKDKVEEKNDPKTEEQIDEEELKKKGFSPQKMQMEEAKEQPISDFDKDYEEFITPTPQQLAEIIQSLKFFPADDEPRHALAYSSGGKICGDPKVVSKIRSIGKQMIKLIGKKIISGDMNLTRVSFPIKGMVPKTALENSTVGGCMMPYFMKKACENSDPVQKMKYIITSIISSAYYMNMFLKPLNPVIGETLQGNYPDGTKIYCQQISHHPPISYFLFIGPNCSYRYSGYYAFEANAGLNSMTLTNKGKRIIQFEDGTGFQMTYSKESYGGVFLGTLRSEAFGSFIIKDQQNNLSCQIKYGKIKKKQFGNIFRPSDYFTGDILKNDKKVSTAFGTYCGFIDFDGVRYWDGRYMKGVKINFQEKTLQSDFRNREDLQMLKKGNIVQAQIEKEKGEEKQRADAKLRQTHKNK